MLFENAIWKVILKNDLNRIDDLNYTSELNLTEPQKEFDILLTSVITCTHEFFYAG